MSVWPSCPQRQAARASDVCCSGTGPSRGVTRQDSLTAKEVQDRTLRGTRAGSTGPAAWQSTGIAGQGHGRSVRADCYSAKTGRLPDLYGSALPRGGRRERKPKGWKQERSTSHRPQPFPRELYASRRPSADRRVRGPGPRKGHSPEHINYSLACKLRRLATAGPKESASWR